MDFSKIPTVLTEFWDQQIQDKSTCEDPIQVFSEEDLAEVSQLWGGDLPESYCDFASRFGSVSLEGDGIPRWLMYSYKDGSNKRWMQGSVSGFLSSYWMKRHRAWLYSDPVSPCFPPGYFPIAQDGTMSFFVMRLDSIAREIWFWEESDEPWGSEDNDRLGFVADSLEDFFQILKTS